MINYKYALCFFLNYTCSIANIKNICNLADYISSQYNLNYSNFTYCVQENGKSKTKSYSLTQKNLDKLIATDSKTITAVSFEKLKQNKSYIDTDLSFEVLLTDIKDCPSTIKVTIDPEILKEALKPSSLISIMEKLEALRFEMEYGIALTMATNKMPMVFLSGLGTPELSQEEREMANSLSINLRQYKDQVWDIFWYNIINKDLIKPDLLSKIKKVVSDDNVFEKGEMYIISLPVQSDEYAENNGEVSKYKSELRKLFRKENIIMYK